MLPFLKSTEHCTFSFRGYIIAIDTALIILPICDSISINTCLTQGSMAQNFGCTPCIASLCMKSFRWHMANRE